MIQTFKLVFAYHGVLFAGYAIQPNQSRTVQGELEKLLSSFFCQPIRLVAAGRTDKGVHAQMQVCSFQITDAPWIIKSQQVASFLQKNLPKDIQLLKVTKVRKDFHARFNVKSKTYEYVIDKKLNISQIHLAHHVTKLLDLQKLQASLNLFVGTHNFWSFSTAPASINPVRSITKIKLINTKKQIKIQITSASFCRSMVRMIVGACLNYATGKMELQILVNWLENPQKGVANYKAPSYGLYLKKVNY